LPLANPEKKREGRREKKPLEKNDNKDETSKNVGKILIDMGGIKIRTGTVFEGGELKNDGS